MDCVNIINVDTSTCRRSCSGLVTTGFNTIQEPDKLKNLFPIIGDYNKYKKITPYPSGLIGKDFKVSISCFLKFILSDYEWKNTLRYVRIYLDSPTFETIEMDRAAKFVDMLSSIGGTMGLLTGFSIISGVEILYFATKIAWSIIQRNKNKE